MDKNNNSTENIKIAFYLNLVFSVVEAIGGFLTNSISIFSDAIHDLGDSISIGVSYLLEKKSKKASDKNYTYGYLRYSLLGALITSIVLLVGSCIVLYNAIPRLFHPESINHEAMIIFAIFGVLINGYATIKTSRSKVKNEKAINLHMLEDTLGWVAILIGSICIKQFNLVIIDPILSILITLYILFHVYKNLKEIFDIFMIKVPSNINIDTIKTDINKEFDSVKDIHNIHIWTLDGINNYMTCHIKTKNDLSKQDMIKLKTNIKEKLNKYEIHNITIEFEYNDEKCKKESN